MNYFFGKITMYTDFHIEARDTILAFMETIFPDAVGERSDGMKTITGWNKTEAILVKALQEAVAKINSLEARLDAANL